MADPTWTEEIRVEGDKVVSKVKELVNEGNVRRITLKTEDGKVLMEVPLTIGLGVVGIAALVAPVLAAIGALAALVARVSIVVERQEPKVTPPTTVIKRRCPEMRLTRVMPFRPDGWAAGALSIGIRACHPSGSQGAASPVLVDRGQNVAIGFTGLPDVPAKRTGATARWKSHWPSSAAVDAHASRSQLSSSHRPIATRHTACTGISTSSYPDG